MTTILTLIAGATEALSASRVESVTFALAHAGGAIVQVDWLCADIACDIYLEHQDSLLVKNLAQRALGGRPIDCIVQNEKNRRKKLLIADMESTLLVEEIVNEMAGLAGVREKVSAITQRAMNGEIDFAASLRERIALMHGLPKSALDDLAKRLTLMPGAKILIATLKAHGIPCYIATGGFSYFAEVISRKLNCDGFFSNELVLDAEGVTGTVTAPIFDKKAKLKALEDLAAHHKIPLADTLAVGDGDNDLLMLSAAGLGIGFHPKPAVADQLQHNVFYADLRSVLFAQGYRAKEFSGI